jgi:hypothetical protein
MISMKKNATIGSEPSKIHYGGAPKNPATVNENVQRKSGNGNIAKGAQASNLNPKKTKK